MRIYFEKHEYEAGKVVDYLPGDILYPGSDGKRYTDRIGYLFVSVGGESYPVFILPKSFLISVDGQDLVLGMDSVLPEDVIDTDNPGNPLELEGKGFLLPSLGLWLYRALDRFRNEHEGTPIGETAKLDSQLPENGARDKDFLATALELIDFLKDHRSLFTIISSSLNSAIRDADWDKKLDGTSSKGGLKKHAAGLVTMEAVLNSTDWDEDHIAERADWLADKANEVWPSYSAATDDVEEEHTAPAAVTVAAPQEPQRTRNTETVDQTVFSINGSAFLKKGAFVRQFIRLYMAKYPDATYADLKRFFTDSLLESGYKFIGLLATVEDWNNWRNDNKLKRYYVSPADAVFVSSDGVRFYVNTQWTLSSVKKVVELAEREGFDVQSQR